jgi:hypothetical protein
VTDFINALSNEQMRKDSLVLLEIMQHATGENPVLWSNSIIGFGLKRYESPATCRQVDWFITGFAPRKANLTVYLIDLKKHEAALQRLGKHKMGGGCVYINRLADVDIEILKGVIHYAVSGEEHIF